MRYLIVVLLLIPSLAFATYTEYYCQSGGSNLNAGSTTNNTAAYTTAAGTWVNSTLVFTVTDGTNPSAHCAVGDFGSVYLTAGATATGFVGRITAVSNATNGTVTFSNTFKMGASPTNGTGTMTLKTGGAWKGMNGAAGFPLTLAALNAATDIAADPVRINLKNDQTYSVTTAITIASTSIGFIAQGYSSSVGDGVRATIDGGTSTATVVSGSGFGIFKDVVFSTSFASATGTLVAVSGGGIYQRCVFTGSRGIALDCSSGNNRILECEFYDCDKGNLSGGGVIKVSTLSTELIRSYVHDCSSGSNVTGVVVTSALFTMIDSVIDSLAGKGLVITSGSSVFVIRSDFYNETSDAINAASSSAFAILNIESTNFIKNGGAAVNNLNTACTGLLRKNGYGSGTQANGSANTLTNVTDDGTSITYTSGVTPYNAPATGDFRNVLAAAQGVGSGTFTETGSSKSGTVGYPDIGAAQANIGCPFPTPTSTPSSTPTPTATATSSFTPCAPTPTATATFTPTNTPTPSATYTPTPTSTASFTPCFATPTATATFTPSATSTPTAIFTPTPTATATFTPTATATNTPTPSATFTPTPTSTVEVSYGFGN